MTFERIEAPYDADDLLRCLMYTQRPWPDERFGAYYTRLLAVLEQLFDVSLGPTGPGDEFVLRRQLWTLIRGYYRVRSPLAGFLEGGPFGALEGYGESGEVMEKRYHELEHALAHTRQAYMHAIEQLFFLLFGRPECCFSREHVLALGVDDTQQPTARNYRNCLWEIEWDD